MIDRFERTHRDGKGHVAGSFIAKKGVLPIPSPIILSAGKSQQSAGKSQQQEKGR